MTVVRFVRKDGEPDEEYYYLDVAEARFHYSLYADDENSPYKSAKLYNFETGEELLV